MIAAIDCDLRKAFVVRDDGHAGRVAAASLDDTVLALIAECGNASTVLFEIVSPLDYTSNKAIAHHKRRWGIWNAAVAARLARALPVLVAPSAKWTRGHSEEQRHLLACCRQPERNLREAEAMLWYHAHHAKVWVPLEAYLATI